MQLAEDKRITTVIQNTTACHDSEHNSMPRFRTQWHATIQNSCDSEYDSMLLSEHNGVPQQKLFAIFMLEDSRPLTVVLLQIQSSGIVCYVNC
jgi:nitrous oxide reductase accessory protein NosL